MKKLLIVLAIMLPFIGASQDFHINEDDTLNIDEIIIQAGKVTDKLQEIPITTSFLSAKKIEIQSINDLTDLSAIVPNLFMPNYGSRLTTPIYIRGIGARINAPSVGLYVDNVPYFDKGSFNFEFFDIKKIEVLRGPQGTLYGRNAMGGLIKIYTPEPTKGTSGYLKAEYGNYNQIKSVLHFNQGIGDKFAFLIDGAYAHKDGFFTNLHTGNQADEIDTYSGRIKMSFKPTKNFKANLSLNYEQNDQLGYPYAIYDIDTQIASDVNYDSESSYNRELFSTGLNLEYNAKLFDVSFSSSFQNLVDAQKIDQDFTDASLFFVTQDRDEKTFVEEFNIKSKQNSKIKWLAGIFAFKHLTDKTVIVDYLEDAVVPYHLPGVMTKIKTYDQPNMGAAIYGQASFPIKKFVFTAGIRADYESSDFLHNYDLEFNGTVSDKDDIDENLTFSEVLPKLSISYLPTENITAFASFTKGYKVGGFNTTIEDSVPVSYEPEESYNYELGLKSSFLNNKLIANFSVFYIDWKNQQLYQTVPSGTGSYTDNAGQSESMGFEFETRIFPIKNLDIFANIGYNEVKFVEYTYKDYDYSGNYLAYIPKYTVSAGGNYKINLNNDFAKGVLLSINYKHFGKLFWDTKNEAYQENYGLLNAKVSFIFKHFDLGLWAQNILDADYNSFYFTALGNSYVQLGTPAQFGASVKIRF